MSGDIVRTVEFLHSFITTNARGDVIGSYTTLDEAEAALTQPRMPSAHRPRRSGVTRRQVAQALLACALPVTGLIIAAMVIGK